MAVVESQMAEGEMTVDCCAVLLAVVVIQSSTPSCCEMLPALSDSASDSSAHLPATVPVHNTITLQVSHTPV